MRLGTSLTIASSVVTALCLLAYTSISVSARDTERREDMRRHQRATGLALRALLEPRIASLSHEQARALSLELDRLLAPSRVFVLPRSSFVLANGQPTPAVRLDTWTYDVPAVALERARRLLSPLVTFDSAYQPNVLLDHYDGAIGGAHVVALPMRGSSSSATRVLGVLMLLRNYREVEVAHAGDWWRSLAKAVFIWLLLSALAWVLVRSLVTRPLGALLSGMESVARGDFSQALLASREDEVGKLTTRFNDMTLSLRAYREQSQQQSDARLLLEKRLNHTERLATIGQLAAEIAHEVGTPLNVISARARAIPKRVDDAGAVEKNARIIAEQSDRITRIIERLLAFTRREVGTEAPVEVDMNAVTLQTMELMVGSFRAQRVRSRLIRAEGLPRVLGSPDRLQQVCLNLAMNAVQALPPGGLLRVETHAVSRLRPGLEATQPQEFVCVEFSDNGPGIPVELRERVFEPFFSLRPGSGSGLGLAICQGIVKEHDGWIEVGDADEGGACFRVFLPSAGHLSAIATGP